MDSEEMTRHCAESLGGVWDPDATANASGSCVTSRAGSTHNKFNYCPLMNDRQMAELIKRHHLHVDQRPGKQVSVQDPHFRHIVTIDGAEIRALGDAALNNAVVRCVALMRKAGDV